VSDFEHAPVNPRPLVAGVRVLDDGMRIEIVRGAGPGRPPLDLDQGWPTPLAPPRPRSTARVLELAEAQYVATGHEDITLGAPHPHDHPDLAGLVAGLRARFRGLGLGLRIPGLPLADQVELLDPARDPRPGPSGTSPHAQVWPLECCPALRRLAGLDAENEAIVEAGRQAFRRGFASIELCVLLGVPGESDADRVAIGALARALSSVAAGGSGGGGKVELKCSLWIPRPHTACAGDAVADPNAFAAAVQAVRNGLGRRRDVRVRADSPDGAVLDAVLGRADRNLGAGLLAAARAGWRVRTAPGRVPEGESVAARILEAAGLDPAAALGPAAAPGPWARVHLADEPPGRES
ncbi:MAG: hypothetical protein JXQ29_00735, partial [Planctomycetes bacterium]|nr:hypothetical protein [Planctomycetota bacterium]